MHGAWRIDAVKGVTSSDRMVSGFLRVLTAEEQSPVQKGKRDDFRGRLVGKTWTSTHGDTFSRTWALSCLGQRLWVMYRCSAKNSDVECSEVDEILQSISEVA